MREANANRLGGWITERIVNHDTSASGRDLHPAFEAIVIGLECRALSLNLHHVGWVGSGGEQQWLAARNGQVRIDAHGAWRAGEIGIPTHFEPATGKPCRSWLLTRGCDRERRNLILGRGRQRGRRRRRICQGLSRAGSFCTVGGGYRGDQFIFPRRLSAHIKSQFGAARVGNDRKRLRENSLAVRGKQGDRHRLVRRHGQNAQESNFGHDQRVIDVSTSAYGQLTLCAAVFVHARGRLPVAGGQFMNGHCTAKQLHFVEQSGKRLRWAGDLERRRIIERCAECEFSVGHTIDDQACSVALSDDSQQVRAVISQSRLTELVRRFSRPTGTVHQFRGGSINAEDRARCWIRLAIEQSPVSQSIRIGRCVEGDPRQHREVRLHFQVRTCGEVDVVATAIEMQRPMFADLLPLRADDLAVMTVSAFVLQYVSLSGRKRVPGDARGIGGFVSSNDRRREAPSVEHHRA